MTPHRPELPESLGEWPSVAVEFVVALNRIRRAEGGNPIHEAADITQQARLWWRNSSAHLWPTSGKQAEVRRHGIEPALLALRRLGAKLKENERGAWIEAPAAAPDNALAEAAAALGLEHLARRAGEAGERGA
jgi:hypothetical protein